MSARSSLTEAHCVLANTPAVLRALVGSLPEGLLQANEGPGTWCPVQVVQHLAWCELDDWVPRMQSIREHGRERTFRPLNREGGFRHFEGWSAEKLLDDFARLRRKNLEYLDTISDPADLALEGTHPEFGIVTLEQLIATWATHDCGHLTQISRVLTKALGTHAGPWRAYISVLRDATSQG